MTQPSFGWYGGKMQLAPWIVTFFPRHTIYVELFGGSGAVLLAKERSKVEVYNDIDHGLVNFYMVMQDEDMCRVLIQKLEDTPMSRELYCWCRDTYRDVLAKEPRPSVEAAYRFYVCISQAFASRTTGTSGWALGRNQSDIETWRRKVAGFPAIHDRMKMVYVEQRPYETLLQDWDGPSSLFYADPPYAPSSRSAGAEKVYEHDFTEEEYHECLCQLQGLQGTVVLSCYATEHDAILREHGWTVLNKGHHDLRGNDKTETLWMSRSPRPTLFD